METSSFCWLLRNYLACRDRDQRNRASTHWSAIYVGDPSPTSSFSGFGLFWVCGWVGRGLRLGVAESILFLPTSFAEKEPARRIGLVLQNEQGACTEGPAWAESAVAKAQAFNVM